MKILAKIKAIMVVLVAIIFVIRYLKYLEDARVCNYEVDNLLKKYNL